MAITYRNGNTATGAASCVITKPTGLAAGDVMFANIVTDTGAVTAPGGWTTSTTLTNGAGNRISCFYLVAGGSEPADYTFSGGTTITQGNIDAFIGVDNTTPLDTANTSSTSTAATVTWPDITTVTDGAWHFAISGDPGGAVGTPSGYTARTVSGAGYAEGSTNEITTAGLVTGITAGGGVDWMAVSVALRPAAGAPTIDVQPVDDTVYEGETASFTLTATTSGGTLSYQWYFNAGAVGTDSNTYSRLNCVTADNNKNVYCDVTDDNGTTSSNTVKLYVLPSARAYYIRA